MNSGSKAPAAAHDGKGHASQDRSRGGTASAANPTAALAKRPDAVDHDAHGEPPLSASQLRAANLVWNAAGDYSLSPEHLFEDVSDAALYANTATGLIYKWFDGNTVRAMADGWHEDYRAAALDDVLWLAYAEAACAREEGQRPALPELRAAFLEELDEDARRALTALTSNGPLVGLGQGEIAQRVRAALLELYGFNGRIVRPADTKLHLGVAFLAPLLRDKADGHERGRIAPAAGTGTRTSGNASARNPLGRAHEKRMRQKEAADRRMVRDLFGPSALSPAALTQLESDTCSGSHAGVRLWIADGGSLVGSAQSREGRELLRAAQEQVDRTESYFAQNRRLVESAASTLSHRLRDRLESDALIWERRQLRGSLDAGRSWRADALSDNRIFRRKVRVDEPALAVWLLLDASGSRSDDAALIAVQAWALARGLVHAGAKARIRSFSSMRGYTVIRKFEAGSDQGFHSLSKYFASGMNRDGLALRVVGREAREAVRRTGDRTLVLVLTDGAPMDDAPFSADADPGLAGREYVGAPAVQDVADEVRALREDGIGVAALYNGDDALLADAKRMYGSSLARLRSLGGMADSAAELIATEVQRR